MWGELRRANVKGIAAGVLVGFGFYLVVQALVGGVISPLSMSLWDEPSLSSITVTLLGAEVELGAVIEAILVFLLAVAVAAWLISGRWSSSGAGAPVVGKRSCPECTEPIAATARRCPHCTAPVALDSA